MVDCRSVILRVRSLPWPRIVSLCLVGVMLVLFLTGSHLRHEPQLRIRATANGEGLAAVYTLHGDGHRESLSMLNQMSASISAFELVFPVETSDLIEIRFDPVIATEEEAFLFSIERMEIRFFPLSQSLTIPLQQMMPIDGVSLSFKEGSLDGVVFPHQPDPQTRILLPVGWEEAQRKARRSSIVNHSMLAWLVLCAALMCLLMNNRKFHETVRAP